MHYPQLPDRSPVSDRLFRFLSLRAMPEGEPEPEDEELDNESD